jgi:hypothetical protein
MKSLLESNLRGRWLVLGVHIGLWGLLYLAAIGLRGDSVAFHEQSASSVHAPTPPPITRLASLLSTEVWPNLHAETNQLDPFFTLHFIPAPKPPAPPPPPPPTTRKIELTYLGFYQTEGAPKQVIAKLADSFLVAPVGTKLTANLFAADATMQTLTLTNSSAQTNLLQLDAKREIDVPAQ